MQGTLNKVSLIGYLGDEVKIHYFDKGNCIARVAIATHEIQINKKTNEKSLYTEWHNLVFFNNIAEWCEKNLTKGDKIYVEGKIKTKHWHNEQGIAKQITEIHIYECIALQTKNLSTKQTTKENNMKETIANFEIPKIHKNNNEELPF